LLIALLTVGGQAWARRASGQCWRGGMMTALAQSGIPHRQ
jgi:hypothetical protein